MLIKGRFGSSSLDVDGWHRILTSRAFGTRKVDLQKTFAHLLIKKLCVKELESTSSLESIVARALIPLDKKPGTKPISVGEVLRRIASKSVTHAAGALPPIAGEDGGVEAVVNAMPDIFFEQNTEAALLVGAKNSYNFINQKIMLLYDMKFFIH